MTTLKSKILIEICQKYDFKFDIVGYLKETDGFKILSKKFPKEKFLEILEFTNSNSKREVFNKILEAVYSKELFDDSLEITKAKYAGTFKLCPTCGKYFIGSTIYCCSKCSNSSKEVKAKKVQTFLERFGVDNAGKTPNSIKAAKESVKILNSSENIEKRREKFKENKDQIMEKMQDTVFSRYGVKNACETDACKKGLALYLESHKVDNAFQVPEVKAKIASKFINGNAQREHIKHFDELNAKGLTRFIDNDRFKITECLEYFNISRSNANKLKVCYGIPEHNNDWDCSSSKGEKELCEFVKSLGLEVKENIRFNNKEIDIFIPALNLGIEYNGYFWHSDDKKPRNYHLNKTKMFEKLGIQLIHVFDTDDIRVCKDIIKTKLGKANRIFARKCKVVELNATECNLFLDNFHIQRSCPASVRLALKYNDEIVEVMTFGKPRFNKNYDWELLRLCTAPDLVVVGGASKLLTWFESHFTGNIISYCDRRFSSGNVYRNLGFVKLRETSPNYFYVKNGKILSRYQCQKSKLSKLLDNFDPNLTEAENMKKSVYLRVFDCGNLVFVKNF